MVRLEDVKKIEEHDENYKPQKTTLLSKYGIPVHHLEFDYVQKCKDAKELEKIYRILKSGEEGYYLELLKVTETKLRLLKPNCKLLRDLCPVLKKEEVPKDEWNHLSLDLKEWQKDINKKDKELDERKVKEVHCNVEIRKIKNESKPPFRSNEKRIASTDYESWDKYDPDTEILKLDLQEEKIKNEALIKQDKLKKTKTVRFSNFATEAEAIYEANSEKERGNECFKAGEYKNALQHYTYSIQCKPLAVGYTNRAIVYIKLKKYPLAINDCREALKLDPKSFKAYLRLAQSYEAIKEYTDALENIKIAITIDPNNTFAQEFANRLYKMCKENNTKNKIRLCIEDIETTNISKPQMHISKVPTKEIIAIPGTSKMPPPYYKVVNSTDPEVIKQEKQKILCKPGMLHMTTIDIASDDETPIDHNLQPKCVNVKDSTTFTKIQLKKGKHIKSRKKEMMTAPERIPLVEASPQILNEDKGAGGEPYKELEEFNILIEDLQSPYGFAKVWNSARKDFSYKQQAEILRKVDISRMHEVIGYNLDENILTGIIHGLHKYLMIPSELDRVGAILINLIQIPRFQMMLLFLSNAERNCIKQLIEFLDQHERSLPNNVRNIYIN
ncbi:hypothetical protein FQA39_LY10992 [Lamprigera yunnana]|nr:hypothetical protein FQA39_LY10992 [Lamprigera yunnana]